MLIFDHSPGAWSTFDTRMIGYVKGGGKMLRRPFLYFYQRTLNIGAKFLFTKLRGPSHGIFCWMHSFRFVWCLLLLYVKKYSSFWGTQKSSQSIEEAWKNIKFGAMVVVVLLVNMLAFYLTIRVRNHLKFTHFQFEKNENKQKRLS